MTKLTIKVETSEGEYEAYGDVETEQAVTLTNAERDYEELIVLFLDRAALGEMIRLYKAATHTSTDTILEILTDDKAPFFYREDKDQLPKKIKPGKTLLTKPHHPYTFTSE